MTKWKKYLPITIACLITGLLLTSALRAQTALDDEGKTNKNQTLIDIINNLEAETKVLEETIDSLRSQIENIQNKETPGQQGYVVSLQDQIQQLKLRSGQTNVSGPGIVIVLDDNVSGAETARINNPDLYNPEDFIVHDKSLLYLISAIRGKAEALAINDQRLVASSDIRCVGTVIMVNSSRLAPPYEIKAIGNPDLLEEAVLNSEEYYFLKSKDMPVTITKVEDISLPAYKGSTTINYTEAVKEEKKEEN
ncbi:MAG: DUF881 domain-containing protein [Bacillota bacterium]|nr:DUF881 domain-containing protein [Clostridia bacterium]